MRMLGPFAVFLPFVFVEEIVKFDLLSLSVVGCWFDS